MKQAIDFRSLRNRQLRKHASDVAEQRGIGSRKDFQFKAPELDGELSKRRIRPEEVLPEPKL